MSQHVSKGVLEITQNGYGFLRSLNKNFAPRNTDPFVPAKLISKYGLRQGLYIKAKSAPPKDGRGGPPLQTILTCNDHPFEDYVKFAQHSDLTSINPEDPFRITRHSNDMTGRLIDALVPIAKGQRGMIISPPKAGKTTVLKHIAQAIIENHKDVHVHILLIDERPEEVTDFKREVTGANVFYSSADQDEDSHLRTTELTMNMATRQLEFGEDVVVLIDSLTRMGRAFNKSADSGGKTLSGGLASNALEAPRRFFGAARKVENGGSLTVLATVLVDTGSRMDEVIFQEFKGTGNMELVLSRECAERRIFPAFNIRESGTRKENLILTPAAQHLNAQLRRKTAGMKPPEALEHILEEFRNQDLS